MALDDHSVLAKVLTSEVPVIEVEREVVLVDDLGEMLDNLLIIPDLVVLSRVPANVASESVQTRIPLLENDGLALDFTYGLYDDLLGHLLQDEETLLDDVNGMDLADEFMLGLDKDLLKLVAVPVIDAVEVVKAFEGVVASPVVKDDVLHGSVDRCVDGGRDVVDRSGDDMVDRGRVVNGRRWDVDGGVYRHVVKGAGGVMNWGRNMADDRRMHRGRDVVQCAGRDMDGRQLMLGRDVHWLQSHQRRSRDDARRDGWEGGHTGSGGHRGRAKVDARGGGLNGRGIEIGRISTGGRRRAGSDDANRVWGLCNRRSNGSRDGRGQEDKEGGFDQHRSRGMRIKGLKKVKSGFLKV